MKLSIIAAPVMLNLFTALYVCVGPYLYFTEGYYYLGRDYTHSLKYVYICAFIFNVIFTFSFIFFARIRIKPASLKATDPSPTKSLLSLKGGGLAVNAPIAIIYFTTVCVLVILGLYGFRLGWAHNLVMILFNSLIPILIFSIIDKKKYALILILLYCAITVYIGFRYRLVLLMLPFLFYFFVKNKVGTVGLLKYAGSFVLIILGVAVVGVARVYSSGLDLTALSDIPVGLLLINGIFNDTSTVLVSGEFIKRVDELSLYAHVKQIFYIVGYFIPHAFWENKEYSPIFSIVGQITGYRYNETGAAILAYAEYFHTAGYVGVCVFAVVFSYFLSMYYKKLKPNSLDYHSLVIYSIYLAWFINSLTRGYFPQNIQDLISIMLGIYILRSKFSKYKFRLGG